MNGPETIRIAGVQMEPILGAGERNLGVMLERLGEAARAGARVVVFPECALGGYCFETLEEARAHAEPLPGPSSARFAEACADLGVYAIYGLLESDGERIFNAVALVGPEGLIATYRKVHLPFLGVDRFSTPGDRPFAAHQAGPIKIGMHICYDGAFPEPARVMSLLGAELIALPTNWPTHSETAAAHLPACRALENVVYAIAVNRVGVERGFRFIGRSSIAGPGGETLAAAGPDEETILYAEVDPARARRKKLVRVPGKHEIDRIGDRRPEFYTLITSEKSAITPHA